MIPCDGFARSCLPGPVTTYTASHRKWAHTRTVAFCEACALIAQKHGLHLEPVQETTDAPQQPA